MDETLTISGTLQAWAGAQAGKWYFVAIGGAAAAELSATALMRRLEGRARGWGSIRVEARIGESAWETSVFPQKEDSGAPGWLLPVKAAIRRAENLVDGSLVNVALRF